ncbi:hypothetical protein ABK040_006222 [Willaertia magna]
MKKLYTKRTILFIIGTLLLLTLSTFVLSNSNKKEEETKTVEEWIQEGDLDFKNSNYQQAIHKYTNGLYLDRENKRLLLKRAETYNLLRKYEFSLNDLNNLINLQNNHLQALSLKGQITLQLGLFDEAINTFSNLLKIKESDDVKNKLEKSKLGKELYNGIINTNIEDNNIVMKFDLKKEEKARNCVTIITKLMSDNIGAKDSLQFLVERATCSLYSKLFSITLQDIKTIYSKYGNNNLQAHILYTKYLYSLGDFDNARNIIKSKCLLSDPDNNNCKELFKLIKNVEKLQQLSNDALNSKDYVKAINNLEEYNNLIENNNILPNIDNLDYKVKLCEAYSQSQESTFADKGVEICTSVIKSLENAENNEFKITCLLFRSNLYLLLDDLEKAKIDINEVKESQNHLNSKYHSTFQQTYQRIVQQERINSQKDYYKTLGFDRKNKDQVSENDIRKAYRKLIKNYHPDKYTKRSKEERDSAAKKYKEITDAYEILNDKEKRKRYDAGEFDSQNPDGQGGGGHPFHDIFQQGGFHFRTGGQGGGFKFHFG